MYADGYTIPHERVEIRDDIKITFALKNTLLHELFFYIKSIFYDTELEDEEHHAEPLQNLRKGII